MAQNPKKKYPDLRYKLIRGLINYEKLQRKAHYQKQAAEWTSKAVVSLEFNFDVIKSVRQATQLEGIGDIISAKLREISKDKRFRTNSADPGKFISSAPALLVALYMLQETIGGNDMLQVGKALVPEMHLQTAAKLFSEEDFVDKEGFCQATWRLHVLANRGLLKKRSRDKLPVYELLPPGEVLAKQLMASVGLQGASFLQVINGLIPDLTALPAFEARPHVPDVAHDHLYTNDDDSDGVVLYVDTREWGGDRLGLIALCQRLDKSNIRYATCHLATGDYGWGWKCQGRKVELPLLIERKRADDLAHSLVDRRYQKQKDKMMTWKMKYTVLHLQQEATLIYVVEGDPETYVVRCADGCGGVGRCGYPNLFKVQAVIRELDTGSEFTLIQTPDRGATIDVLVTLTRELQMRINNGDFHDLLRHVETLEFDMNYSKPNTAAKKAGKATKAAKKQKSNAGEGTNNLNDAFWDGLIPHGPQTHQPEGKKEESSEAKATRPKKQRKRKAKLPVVNIDENMPHAYVPYDANTAQKKQHQRFAAGVDLPPLVHVTAGFEPSCGYGVGPSYPQSTSTVTSSDSYPENCFTLSHMEEPHTPSNPCTVVKKPFTPAVAAAHTSDYFSDDAIRLPLEPKRTKAKVRKVHEITWSDEEEELPYQSDTTSLPNPDNTEASDNKWWHTSSSSSSIPYEDEPMVKAEPVDHSYLMKTEAVVGPRCPLIPERHVDYESVFKTEAGTGENASSMKQEAWGSVQEVRAVFKTEAGTSENGSSMKQEAGGGVQEVRWSAELRSIRVILPDTDEDLARKQLDIHAGNVEAVISVLLDSM